jgi:phage tail sheath protein FI
MATTTTFNTPGVYIEEIPVIPSSIVSVPTAVPVFVGYTQTALKGTKNLLNQPTLITSLLEYTQYFGSAQMEAGIVVQLDTTVSPPVALPKIDPTKRSIYLMYYSVELYFANGGGTCYIMSIGDYSKGVIESSDYLVSDVFRPELEKYVDITLVVCPDLTGTDQTSYYKVQTAAIDHCGKMLNRMAVMDVYRTSGGSTTWLDDVNFLRSAANGDSVFPGLQPQDPVSFKYAAVYFPRVLTTQSFLYDDTKVNVLVNGSATGVSMNSLKAKNSQQYYTVENAIDNNLEMLMPAAPAMVGIYANVDDTYGVWRAPANFGVVTAVDLEEHVSASDQGNFLNVDPIAGKSINAIRSFPNRGSAIVWGARTLAGNDNEWRYIPVRRFFFMVEQSIKNAIEPFVFQPNDENTWTRVTAMIANYLTEQWKAGALMGTTTKDAFQVQVGLGITMTPLDVLEGRMIVVVRIAVVRPAEFIILKFEQLMPPQS